MHYRFDKGEVTIEQEDGGYRVMVGERLYHVVVRRTEAGALAFDIDGQQYRASVAVEQGRTFVALEGSTFIFEQAESKRRRAATQPGLLTAAMPGQVIAIYVATGDQVDQGQPLLLLTAMKMEMVVSAPEAGVVRAVNVTIGDTVARDQELIQLQS